MQGENQNHLERSVNSSEGQEIEGPIEKGGNVKEPMVANDAVAGAQQSLLKDCSVERSQLKTFGKGNSVQCTTKEVIRSIHDRGKNVRA